MKFDNQTKRLYLNVGIYVVLGGLFALFFHENLIVTAVGLLISYFISYSISHALFPRSKDTKYKKEERKF